MPSRSPSSPRLSILLCWLVWALSTSPLVGADSTHAGPITYFSLVENPRISTPSSRVHAHSKFDVTFTLHRGKQEVKLVLEPNNDIYADGPIVNVYNEDGTIAKSERWARSRVRAFKGGAWIQGEFGWEKSGNARVYVYEDGDRPLFDGSFTIGNEVHHIQRKSRYLKNRQPWDAEIEEGGEDFMIVYRDSDMDMEKLVLQARDSTPPPARCIMDDLDFNSDDNHPIRRRMVHDDAGLTALMKRGMSPANIFGEMLSKRQYNDDTTDRYRSGSVRPLRDTIGQTAGCPSGRLVALMGIASDCTYGSDFDSNEEVTNHIISLVNQASMIFEASFNIVLAARQVNIQPRNCPGSPPSAAPWNLPCSAASSNGRQVTLEDRLNIFSAWRGTVKGDGIAFWTLMTKCTSDQSVGLAWLGQLCKDEASIHGGSTVSGVNVVAKSGVEWKVLAHEIGHTFGAVHDCTTAMCRNSTHLELNKCCPRLSTSSVEACSAENQFLMNVATSDNIERFSPCTIGGICAALGSRAVDMSCLVNNKNVPSLVQAVCGNGIVEEGEECDCGGEQRCGDNPCCNGATCTLKQGAVCDDSTDDCCSSCQFKPKDTICRASNGPCDPQEVCTGTSASCPKDELADDGDSCGSGGNFQCASGQCTTRNKQCQDVLSNELGRAVAWDTSSCVITCRTEKHGPNTIVGVNQNFLDGTVCNSDGRCRNGKCEGASALGGVKSWIESNKTVVIVVAAVVGGLIVISILSCIISCFRNRGKKGRNARRNGGGLGRMPSRVIGSIRNRNGDRSRSRAPGGINPNQYPMAEPMAPNPAVRMGPNLTRNNTRRAPPPSPPQPFYYEPSSFNQQTAARYG